MVVMVTTGESLRGIEAKRGDKKKKKKERGQEEPVPVRHTYQMTRVETQRQFSPMHTGLIIGAAVC